MEGYRAQSIWGTHETNSSYSNTFISDLLQTLSTWKQTVNFVTFLSMVSGWTERELGLSVWKKKPNKQKNTLWFKDVKEWIREQHTTDHFTTNLKMQLQPRISVIPSP